MTKEELRARIDKITSDWDAESESEKTHEAVDKLQIDVLTAIADAPTRATKLELKEMANMVVNLNIDLDARGLDRWYA